MSPPHAGGRWFKSSRTYHKNPYKNSIKTISSNNLNTKIAEYKQTCGIFFHFHGIMTSGLRISFWYIFTQKKLE